MIHHNRRKNFSKVIKGLAIMTPKKIVLTRNNTRMHNNFFSCNRKVMSPNQANLSRNLQVNSDFHNTSPRNKTVNIKDKILKAQNKRRNLFSPQTIMRNLQSTNNNQR
jgi:hypothetical protein